MTGYASDDNAGRSKRVNDTNVKRRWLSLGEMWALPYISSSDMSQSVSPTDAGELAENNHAFVSNLNYIGFDFSSCLKTTFSSR